MKRWIVLTVVVVMIVMPMSVWAESIKKGEPFQMTLSQTRSGTDTIAWLGFDIPADKRLVIQYINCLVYNYYSDNLVQNLTVETRLNHALSTVNLPVASYQHIGGSFYNHFSGPVTLYADDEDLYYDVAIRVSTNWGDDVGSWSLRATVIGYLEPMN